MSFLRTTLYGRLGADPELKVVKDGLSLATLSVAVDSLKGGEKSTDWHKVTVFGKTADNVAKYLHKGSECIVEGDLTLDKWKDKEGGSRMATNIVARNVTFIGSKPVQDSVQPQVAAGNGYIPF